MTSPQKRLFKALYRVFSGKSIEIWRSAGLLGKRFSRVELRVRV